MLTFKNLKTYNNLLEKKDFSTTMNGQAMGSDGLQGRNGPITKKESL